MQIGKNPSDYQLQHLTFQAVTTKSNQVEPRVTQRATLIPHTSVIHGARTGGAGTGPRIPLPASACLALV